jgi:uncharacterized protein involved in exopolysaccharide biosynthesis
MSNIELIKQLVKRLKKFSWLIAAVALVFAAGFFLIARQSVPLYTSTATVFPLNSSSDNTISTSAISNILGLADAPKSFSSEAAINIVELATSRRTREAVATAQVPELKNKTIAELLVEEQNKHTGFMQNEAVKLPMSEKDLVNNASFMLSGSFTAKINKNGILELHYSNTDPDLVKRVSYIFIYKISEFYIDLKKKKAQIDYEFAVKKADSLKFILDAIDRKAVQLDESTFFTNNELKRFNLPKMNLAQDKQSIQSQYYYAVNNREASAYKLQKETPVIETLDKPEGPYFPVSKNPKLYAFIGLLFGALIGAIIVSWKVISQYVGAELNKAIEKASQPKNPAVGNTAPPPSAV